MEKNDVYSRECAQACQSIQPGWLAYFH